MYSLEEKLEKNYKLWAINIIKLRYIMLICNCIVWSWSRYVQQQRCKNVSQKKNPCKLPYFLFVHTFASGSSQQQRKEVFNTNLIDVFIFRYIMSSIPSNEIRIWPFMLLNGINVYFLPTQTTIRKVVFKCDSWSKQKESKFQLNQRNYVNNFKIISVFLLEF